MSVNPVSFLFDLASAAMEIDEKTPEERAELLAKYSSCAESSSPQAYRKEVPLSKRVDEMAVDIKVIKAALAALGLENWDALREKYVREHKKE